MRLTKKMKQWFGSGGEVDIDYMLRIGFITEKALVKLICSIVDSPWNPNNKKKRAKK